MHLLREAAQLLQPNRRITERRESEMRQASRLLCDAPRHSCQPLTDPIPPTCGMVFLLLGLEDVVDGLQDDVAEDTGPGLPVRVGGCILAPFPRVGLDKDIAPHVLGQLLDIGRARRLACKGGPHFKCQKDPHHPGSAEPIHTGTLQQLGSQLGQRKSPPLKSRAKAHAAVGRGHLKVAP
jgi:hypothetical protein